MNKAFIISCEHAGNKVPVKYQSLFRGHEQVLNTHQGYDIGAFELTKTISSILHIKPFTCEVTRLLIDLNRSLHNTSVFSKFSRTLSKDSKQKLIYFFYRPFREKVKEAIISLVEQGYQVIHVGVHTFTPHLDYIMRQTDIGLLYDPARPSEKNFCQRWKENLSERLPELRVRMNDPYRGISDGFVTSLKKEWTDVQYLGIELEVNQQFVLAGNGDQWREIQIQISHTLQKSLS